MLVLSYVDYFFFLLLFSFFFFFATLTGRLEGLCDHVVDEAVRVGDAAGLELLLVLVLVDLLEDVLETPVVHLEFPNSGFRLSTQHRQQHPAEAQPSQAKPSQFQPSPAPTRVQKKQTNKRNARGRGQSG